MSKTSLFYTGAEKAQKENPHKLSEAVREGVREGGPASKIECIENFKGGGGVSGSRGGGLSKVRF